MARRTSAVVLVEADDPDGASAPTPVPHPLRTPAGRRLVLLAAAALVASLVADLAADRTRLAAVDDVPFAIRTLPDVPRPRWVLDEQTASVLDLGAVVGGVLVGPVGSPQGWSDGAEGVTGFVGLDPDDGTRLWEMPVTAPGVGGGPASIGWCAPAADLALCTTQGVERDGRAAVTELWLLDPRDGLVVREWAGDASRSTGSVGDLLVEQTGQDAEGRSASPDAADHVVVTASDPASGRTRWTWTSPSARGVRGTWWSGSPTTSGQWLVARGERAWLLDEDGTARQYDGLVDGAWADVLRGGGLVQVIWRDGAGAGPDQTRYFPATGTPLLLPAPPMWLRIDDGSAPGLLVLQGVRDGAGFVAAVDAATGDVRWSVDVDATQAMLVGGRLVLLRAQGLTALDVRSGEQLWTARSEGTLRGLSTDGELALAAHGDALLEAFSLADGRRVWERDLAPAAARAGGDGQEAGADGADGSGAWLRLDTPLPYPVVVRPDGAAVVMG